MQTTCSTYHMRTGLALTKQNSVKIRTTRPSLKRRPTLSKPRTGVEKQYTPHSLTQHSASIKTILRTMRIIVLRDEHKQRPFQAKRAAFIETKMPLVRDNTRSVHQNDARLFITNNMWLSTAKVVFHPPYNGSFLQGNISLSTKQRQVDQIGNTVTVTRCQQDNPS